VSYQVSKRITQPILGLAWTAGQIRQGDLEQRARVSSRDEIGALAEALNAMAEKLSSDISRMKKLEQVRSEFLGNVSHELRTPIFSLQGFLETLLDGAIDDPAVNREFLERAHRQATRSQGDQVPCGATEHLLPEALGRRPVVFPHHVD